MIEKIIKYGSIGLVLLFFFFFFVGDIIYKNRLTTKTILTEEQIKKFEEDVKNGVNIDINDYVVRDKDYQNNVTRVNDTISSLINKTFKQIFKYLLKSIDV